jgi:Na+/H+ antiporter NhaD/arsenite permease-like protein
VALILAADMAMEIRYYRKEPPGALEMDRRDYVPMRLKGSVNLVALALVILAVLLSAPIARAGEAIHFPFVREVILVIIAMLSLKLGPRGPRASNHFHWAPIVEVAVLFAGIFATMIPALAVLNARGAELGLSQPHHFFWATGFLSSFLDNAPTYLTFASVASGLVGTDAADLSLLLANPHGASLLAAISAGAVLMGANTYVGNGPNFMVKAIAEQGGVRMPGFFAYMGYAAVLLLPLFVAATFLFFR